MTAKLFVLLTAVCGLVMTAISARADDALRWVGEAAYGIDPMATSGRVSATCVTPPPNSVMAPRGCRIYPVHASKSEMLQEGSVRFDKLYDSGLALQVDAMLHHDESLSDVHIISRPLTDYGGALHLGYRGADYRFGAILSAGNDGNEWFVSPGIEGQYFFDNVTLFGQTLLSQRLRSHNLQSVSLALGVRAFLSDNFTLESSAGGAFSRRSWSGGITWPISAPGRDEVGMLQLAGKAEYRFDSLPLGLFFKYRYSTGALHSNDYYLMSAIDSGSLFTLGIRFYVGSGSLIDHDRNGPSLEDGNPWYGTNPFLRRVYESFRGVPIPT